MPLACPACNKASQTDAVCQRCGCDLARLHDIVVIAAARLGRAVGALANRDWPAALAAAESSWRLCHTVESARVAFLASAAAGDPARALWWHERATAGARA